MKTNYYTITVLGNEVQINERIATAYVKICTDLNGDDETVVINEIQRVADYDTHEDKGATDEASLMNILVGRIEHKLNKYKQEREANDS